MRGANATLSIRNFGERRLVVTRIAHGMSIWNSSSDESRTRHSFTPSARSSGSFDVEAVFTSSEAREEFAEWLRGYMMNAASPWTNTHPARLIVPSRRIDRVGVPSSSEMAYGDRMGDILYPLSLGFAGTSDPQDRTSELASKFVLPESSDPSLPYLYPAGSQLRGDMGEDDEGVYEPDYLWELEYLKRGNSGRLP